MIEKQPRNLGFLVVGITGLSVLAWFTSTYAPEQLWLIALFFLILFFSCTSLLYFLINNVRRTIIIALGIVVFLILRWLQLREPLYPILLIASLISIELLLRKR